ncbi:hypothetical protein GCM10009682_60120 [Luedemannella flava]|uniref:OmpR/PhoB-type domain-containing protein n=1 Tax=Luedemannella flava TaxID=349316 RepID=A0ABP4YZL3_9ACTN
MTVTVLRTHTPRNTRPLGPPTPRTIARRRGADPPAEVTLTVGVTLAGDRPHRDALEFIDALNRLAEQVGATLSITSGPESDAVADVRPIGLVETTPTEFELDPWTRVVRRHGTPVQLTKVEYDLLEFLVDNPQQVFTRRQLLGQIWRDDRSGRRTVDVHVSRLRAKLGADIVTTTRGVGYRLTDGAPITVVHHRPNGDVHE